MSAPRLVLASASPRRRELLEAIGARFEVRPAAVDETPHDGEASAAYVARLADAKARVPAAPGELVLAADTVVTQAGALLGKPADARDARRMLRQLAGREHEVLTGVALADASRDRVATAVERTRVWMAPLADSEIEWYVASGEPMDKAGAYAVQGRAGLFIERIEGSYSNVVGLPMATVYKLLRQLGHRIEDICDRA